LRWHFGIRIKGFKIDTWVQKHLMDENPPSDLEFCCDLEMGWGDYSAERRKITGQGKKLKATFDKVPDDILWPYGATDALGTYRLACIYTQRLQQEHPNLWNFYLEESDGLINALAKAEYKGALLDEDVTDALDVEWQAELDKMLVTMRAFAWPEFNPSSNPDVLQAFLSLGITNLELKDESTASGYTTNKKKLQEITETSKDKAVIKFADNVLMFRNRRKMISTYINNARKDLDNDGRLRYGWVQAGPVTGRLSCRFFHQIPKIDDSRVTDIDKNGKAVYVPIEKRLKQKRAIMRDMLIAPKGYVYVYGDYSQVELRILAILAQDQEMLRILGGGGDMHGATTFEFLEPVYPGYTEAKAKKDKFNRTEVGKRVNFGLAYGSEGHALVKTGKWRDAQGKERQFTWDMLNQGMRNWKNRFVGVGDFIDNTPDLVRMQGSVATNVFGRERHFGGQLTHRNEYERSAAERECINFFIQSVAAALTNRTIIEIDKMLEGFNISEDDICLVNTVHDSIAYEVREDLAEWFVNAMNTISLRSIPQLGNNTFKIDVGIGKSWTEAEMAA
jgi:DNA polymerase-1